ncbi:MAG: hypothetical protein ACSLFP_08180 [Acidimicrobiales bacterium]
MRSSTRITAALMAVGLLALVACGDDDDPVAEPDTTIDVDDLTTTSSPPSDDGDDGETSDDGVSDIVDDAFLDDPCPLLEGVDLEALLGEPAGAPEAGTQTCRVQPAAEGSRGNLQLVVATSRAADNYDTQQETFGVDSEVAGLGDAAFHSGPYLFVLDGEVLAFVQVIRDSSLGVGVDDADLEAAMATVLDNIASA